jgi:hypothetical protein
MKNTIVAIIAAGFALTANAQIYIQDIGPNMRTFSGTNGQTITCIKVGPNLTSCN